MGFVVRFVDQISATPNLRLDLNDGTTWTTLAEGTDVSPPELDRQMVSTMLVDGVQIPAAAYQHRVVRLRLMLNASTVDAAATAFQALVRELDRQSNILMWKPESASSPVFFRTFRSDPGTVGEFLDWRQKYIDIAVIAEPFALGTKVSATPVAVSNNPALTNGLYLDVSSVQGDVETPAILSMPANELPFDTDVQTAIGVRRRGTPGSMFYYVQAETGINESISTYPGNDAAMSGAGSNYVRITPVTTTLVRAILWEPVTSASAELRGTYRVFVRYRRSSATGNINLQLRWGYTQGTMVENAKAATDLSTSIHMIDLGLIQFPLGLDPVSDLSNVEYPVSGVDVALYIERLTGTSTVDVDYLAFVPADDRLGIAYWPRYNGNMQTVYADASDSAIFSLTAGGAIASSTFPSLVGGLPMLSPGVTNRLIWLRQVHPAETNTLTDTSTVTVAYFPRYLYVRPAST